MQSIVADGQTLWLFDADLNQVTARKQSQVLSATPAALIAAAPDLLALQADFNLSDAPDKDGLQWVLATPKSKDGQLQAVRVGFKVAGIASEKMPNLAALETVDSALFAVALVDDTPDSVEGLTRQFLLSDGRNRWFDKSYVEMLAKTVTVACCVGAGSVPAW